MVEKVARRKYLKAASPKTLIWYQCSFKAFDGATISKGWRQRALSPANLGSQFVGELGVRPTRLSAWRPK
jgi:hypothetical protein